jgi:hypothetical protein
VITTKAEKNAELFTGIAASLTPGFPLYLPETTLDNPQPMLPMLVSLGKAFWTARRQPTAVVYHTVQAIAPTSSFMIIGQPSVAIDAPLKLASGRLSIHKPHSMESILDIDSLEAWTVAQVVKVKGQYGVQVIPARVSPKTPYWPDAYGNTNLVISRGDSTVYQLNSAGRDAGLLFNDGPTLIERFKADWLLWGAFALLAVGPIIILSIRALVRRTPRRVLTRGFNRSGPVAQS